MKVDILAFQDTAYFAQRVLPLTTKAIIKSAIQYWKECQMVDNHPPTQFIGKKENLRWIAIDDS